MMVKVKICGTTNLEDAIVAADAGADYLGFVFYAQSRRAIDVPTAVDIVKQLRQRPSCPVLVGVFVDEPVERMQTILDDCQLDLAQLHGSEPPWLIGDERSSLYGRAFKALRPIALAEAEADAEWFAPPPTTPVTDAAWLRPSLLIDSYHPTLPGGSGQRGNWAIAAQLAKDIPGIMLAGGLTPENVAEAIATVRPFAVDVASGVEQVPGKKDPTQLHRFIENAKNG